MGYSCNARCSYVMDSISNWIYEKGNTGSSNTWKTPKGTFFYERGRENKDGAITGTVFKMTDEGMHCKAVGSYKIDPNGKIVRFAHIPKEVKKDAEKYGEKKYKEFHSRPLVTFIGTNLS